jgi:hypothetical protein
MLVGTKQYLRIAVAAEVIAFGVQGRFELWGIIDLAVVNEEVPRILVAHRLMPEGRDVLNRQTAVPEAKYRLARRNYNPTAIVWTAMNLRVEHCSKRQLDSVRGYFAQNCRNATHRLVTCYVLLF